MRSIKGKTGLCACMITCMLAVGAWTTPSHADHATVSNFINSGQGAAGQNTLVDDNREYLIDRVGDVTGQIDVGDSIRGMAIWTKLNGNALGHQTPNNEFTSVYQVMVTGKEDLGDGTYKLTFGPDPTFAEAQTLGLDGSAMMIFYEDSSPNAALDYNDPLSPLASNSIDDGTTFSPPSSEDVGTGANFHEEMFISTATDGDYYWALGFTGEAGQDGISAAGLGEGWITENGVTDNVIDFFSVDSGTDLGSFNWSLDRVETAGKIGLGEGIRLVERESFIDSNYTVDFNGSSTLEGVRNELTAFEISSQSTLTFAVVPLPSAAWMGMTLLGSLGGLRWWRKRQLAA